MLSDDPIGSRPYPEQGEVGRQHPRLHSHGARRAYSDHVSHNFRTACAMGASEVGECKFHYFTNPGGCPR